MRHGECQSARKVSRGRHCVAETARRAVSTTSWALEIQRLSLHRWYDQGHSILWIPDDHDLRVRRVSKLFGGLYSLPGEQRLAYSLSDCLLEVCNSLSFNPLAFRFLTFFLKNKLHSQRLLLGGELLLDRILHFGRQLNVPDHHLL